jgi:putative ABC transport system permease protein
MWRDNLKVAIRRIVRNYKSNLLIFAGLVIGLTSCLVIYTKVSYELSFDSIHTQAKDIYRIVRVTSGLEYLDGGLEYRTGVHFPLPGEFKKSIPELKEVAAMLYVSGQKINVPSGDSTPEKSFLIDNGIVFTEPSYFDIFDFGKPGNKWIKGEGKEVLKDPFSAVITKETALKLFSDTDPVGKDILIFGTKFTVKGVIQDLPENTDLPFKVLLSMSTFLEKLNPGALSDWGSLSDVYQCYVVLNRGARVQSVENKFRDVYRLNAAGAVLEGRQFKLQHLSQVHREEQFGNYNNRTVSSGLLLAISLIGAFIFLIACFNYSNFFLAETLKQKKQIALKLILGSKPVYVFFGLLTESLLVCLVAMLISLQFAYPVIKNFYDLIDIPQGYFPHIGLPEVLFTVILVFSGAVLSVIFSIFNLKLKSLSSLLKRSDTVYSENKHLFEKGSVILQFLVAQVVIIATLIIVKQIYFINHKEMGYNTSNILFARIPANSISKTAVLTNELLSVSGVNQVSCSSVLPAESRTWTNFSLFINNEKKSLDGEIKSIDTSFLMLYSFSFLAGQNFTSKDSSDNVIVNKEFITESGFKNVRDALGYTIQMYGNAKLTIKGIVDDFHSGSLRNKIRPCVFVLNPGSYNTVNIKLSAAVSGARSKPDDLSGTIDIINKKLTKVFPDQTFEYRFLSDQIARYYKSEQNALSLFLLFASITIFLCILGIMGLSLSMNERRTKEIGLRKVNGATIQEVIILLNRDIVRWVIIAFIIAVPIALLVMHRWLQNFAYKTHLSWWIFILGGILALFISLIAVSWQSWRAATKNPVEALRYE